MPRRDSDPYGTFRFKVFLGGVLAGGFAECTGLAVETKVLEVPEGGRNESPLKFPEASSFGNITLKRGVTRSNELLAWQMAVVGGTFDTNPRSQDFSQPFFSGQSSQIAIELHDEKDASVRRWTLVRAFPVKWVGPDLKASASEVAIETLELTHEGLLEVAV